MHYEQGRTYRPGHTSRRWYKKRLRRAHRRLERIGLRHCGTPLPSLRRSVQHYRSEMGWGANWDSQSHNTKPRYKDRHDLGIRGYSILTAENWWHDFLYWYDEVEAYRKGKEVIFWC